MVKSDYWVMESRVETRPFVADILEWDSNWAEVYRGGMPSRAVFCHLQGARTPGHIVSTTIPFLMLFDDFAFSRAVELELTGLEFYATVLKGKRRAEQHEGYRLAVVRGRVRKLRLMGLEGEPVSGRLEAGGYEIIGDTNPSFSDFVAARRGHLCFVSGRARAFILDLAERDFDLTLAADVRVRIEAKNLDRVRAAQGGDELG